MALRHAKSSRHHNLPRATHVRKDSRLTEKRRSMLISISMESVQYDQGYAYACDLSSDVPVGDVEVAPFRSQARLFEDGREIGPKNTPHDQIRTEGAGRFSHWNNQLHFSASDNTSPVGNGRTYQLLIPASMFLPDNDDISVALDTFPLDEMRPMERFNLARRVFRRMWRDTPLPDHGRHIEQDRDFAMECVRLCPESDVTYERRYALDQLFKLVLDVDGDVAECGTYQGGSAFFMARHIVERRLVKRLCLFDSFKGLSVPGEVDGDYWHSGALTSSIDDVRRALAPLGATPFVEFYEEWIPARFAEVEDRRFCFVHIDVDLHQPSLDSIAFFYPRMEQGGIILLDDYGFDSCPGVTKAIDEFMADKSEPIINLSSGGAFIMKRASGPR